VPDPVYVLTGGTGHLGTALAHRLVASGGRLAVSYLIPEEAEAFEAALDVDEDRLMLRRVDATSAGQVTAFLDEVAETFGGFHGVAALVGGWAGGRDIAETDDLRLDRMFDLNLRSAFYAVRAAIPHLRRQPWGRIVLIGSTAASEAPIGQAAFNIAKAGVVALGETAASELAEYGITVNVVMPSLIDTPATRAALPFADYVDWPEPDEIASVIEYLLGEDAGVVNGAVIPAPGRT
jgi:NAD(P)-dependent dehydrogenase (short-subunit alcohol dehydrogenase family)